MAPVEITAPEFVEKVAALPDDRSRALEMKHALGRHLATRMQADPVGYEVLGERLEQIVRTLGAEQDEAAAVAAMLGLRDDIAVAERAGAASGLDRWTEQPVLGVLQRATGSTAPRPDLVDAARTLALEISDRVDRPHFHYSTEVREELRRHLVMRLVTWQQLTLDEARRTADELVRIASSSRERFLRLGDR